MIKKSLKVAIPTSFGLTFGAVILPRLAFPGFYFDTYIPAWQYALLFWMISLITSFFVHIFICWMKPKFKELKDRDTLE